jgi:hypothetical protein
MNKTYNLLKSRTFWTLVFIFVFNGYSAISGQIPAGADIVINAALTTIASLFHLSTGTNSTTTVNDSSTTV